MRALLLILIPMGVLAAVMTFVFWTAADRNGPSPAPEKPVARAPSPLPAAPITKPQATESRPSTRLASRPSTGPGTTSRPLADTIASAAEALDDWANIARSRLRRDRTAQLAAARQALATSRPAEAVAACDQILAYAPDDVEALSAKALALVALGRFSEAATLYEHAVRLSPDDLRLRYNYAVILSRLKVFGQAIRQYEFILSRQPDHAKAAYNLAMILQDEGKLTDAAKLWERVTKTNPDLPEAWVQRGTLALQLADYETAVVALERAEKLEPGKADLCANLGTAYHGLGRAADAIAAYRRAQTAQPNYLPAINGMAEVYLSYFERHPDAADQLECGLHWCEYSFWIRPDQPRLIGLYRKALKVQPDCLPAMNGLARVLAATNPADPQYETHREQAVELCRRSLTLNPDQPDVTALLERLTGQPQP